MSLPGGQKYLGAKGYLEFQYKGRKVEIVFCKTRSGIVRQQVWIDGLREHVIQWFREGAWIAKRIIDE